MKVLLMDGTGGFVVRVDEGDVPPGMERVVVVDDGGGIAPASVIVEETKLGSLLAQGDPEDWIPFAGVDPPSVLEAVRRHLR